jgi:Carboxypeptidase regulatory-like domain
LRRQARRAFSMIVVLVLTWTAAGAPARALQGTAAGVSLSGRLFQADGVTPLAGARVRITDPTTGKSFESAPTDNAGHYEMSGLAPATYQVEVEVPEGIYKLNRSVRLGEADQASISFTVKPETLAEGATGAGALATPEGKKRKGALLAIILGGAALAAFVLSDDDNSEPQASQAAP